MKAVHLLAGLCCSTIVFASTRIAAQASPEPSKDQNSQALCEVQFSNGNIQNLDSICGKASQFVNNQTEQIYQTRVPMIVSDKPSALWQSVPDLPSPPIVGKTHAVKSDPTQVGVKQVGSNGYMPTKN
jgi:hypothetical protein